MTAPAAVDALDRAVVDALEVAARAAEPLNDRDSWDWTGDCEKTDAFLNAAHPGTILQLAVDWKLLADQNEIAFNHNRDLGASNDELRLRVHRLEVALRDSLGTIEAYLSYSSPLDPYVEDARAMRELNIDDFEKDGRLERARAALEGSTHRG